jgi:hypothetical protein
MITSNNRSGIKSSNKKPIGDNFMETISGNRLTKVGNNLLNVYPKELHGAYLAAEARVLKGKDITLPNGTPIDPANPSSITALEVAARKHMESKATVNTGPKKRDIAANFLVSVESMLEDIDTSAIEAYPGWGFKVEYDGHNLEVVKVEKHRVK